MASVQLEAHCIDDDFRQRVADAGCAIVDETDAPWRVEFEGPRAALEKLITDEWGYTPCELSEVLGCIEGD